MDRDEWMAGWLDASKKASEDSYPTRSILMHAEVARCRAVCILVIESLTSIASCLKGAFEEGVTHEMTIAGVY